LRRRVTWQAVRAAVEDDEECHPLPLVGAGKRRCTTRFAGGTEPRRGETERLLQNPRKNGRGGTRPSRNPRKPPASANGGPASTPAAGGRARSSGGKHMQRAMDPMTEAKTETPSAGYVLRRRYVSTRYVITYE
jgi:hypothetical protein